MTDSSTTPANETTDAAIEQTFHLVIAEFPDEDTAKSAYNELIHARRAEELDFEDAARVERDESEKLHIHETGDTSAGRGAAVGGAIGAVLGLLAGPAGMVVGGLVGAWYGGLAAGAVDAGIPDMSLAEVGALLEPGKAAVVVLTDDENREAVRERLRAAGGRLLTGNAEN
ncbi:MAG: DUF1269 domain-containing protein [Chloroflexi bacterium]|nr:DUF1269 domain-containing protein [Chloroflexota bacterium]